MSIVKKNRGIIVREVVGVRQSNTSFYLNIVSKEATKRYTN